MSVESADQFRFCVSDHYDMETAREKEGILLGDGAMVLMDENSTVGKEEFCK